MNNNTYASYEFSKDAIECHALRAPGSQFICPKILDYFDINLINSSSSIILIPKLSALANLEPGSLPTTT